MILWQDVYKAREYIKAQKKIAKILKNKEKYRQLQQLKHIQQTIQNKGR